MKIFCFLSAGLVMGIGWFISGCASKAPFAPTAGPPVYSFLRAFGSAGSTVMLNPTGLCAVGSDLWVSNEYLTASSVEKWTASGSAAASVGSYNSTGFYVPRDITAGPDGYLYVADGGGVIVELDSTGAFAATFANVELGSDDTDAVAVNASTAYVLDDGAARVIAYSISGSGNTKTFSASATFGEGILGAGPEGMSLDDAGNIYVADGFNHRIVKFNSAGVSQLTVGLASGGLPEDVAVDKAGYIYAADNVNDEVQMFDASGGAVTQFGASRLTSAEGIALDESGNLYVTDSDADQVVVFEPNKTRG